VVPGLLLLVARDLLLHDPPRVLAWRLLHDERLASLPGWLSLLAPRPSGDLDRDPIALLLGAAATLLALVYLALAALGAGARARGAVIVLASAALVVVPSAAFVALGFATDRPYGQDGGVVQLPLALDKILSGESPYGADYSTTILGRIARASAFWEPYGGNPILRHHAYLPGTHVVMMPFHLLARAGPGAFDPRLVTLVFYAAAALLAARLPGDAPARLCAAAVAALNPLVWWHQVFGANDLVFVALLLAAVLLAREGKRLPSAAVLGFACATKQLAWPFAPFLLLFLSGARSLADFGRRETWARLAGPSAVALAVFAGVVLPVAALDFRAFYGDIVAYNVGLSGADNYPLGGTPGIGFANFLIYFGRVTSLQDHVPFGAFYLLLVPLGLLLAARQLREGTAEAALLTGAVALVATLYFSRVVHPNYLIPAAVLLPVALLSLKREPDLALVPLSLLALAVEAVENGVFRETWREAVASGHPGVASGLPEWLLPRAGPGLTEDPLGLLFAAVCAGLAVACLATAALPSGAAVRGAIVAGAAAAAVALPLLVVVRVGERTGVPRAQDAWVVRTRADAARLAAGRSPFAPPPAEGRRGREAWSSSFRLEPPRELTPDRPDPAAGASSLARWLRPVGRDPRLLVLAALLVLGILVARAAPGRMVLALGLAWLVPPLALGTVFGSPAALLLAGLAGAWLATRAGTGRGAALSGVGTGVAAAFDHRAILAAPGLAREAMGSPRSWWQGLLGALLAYSLLAGPAIVADPASWLARLAAGPGVGPGVGLANVFAYWGAEGATPLFALLALGPVLTAMVAVLLFRRRDAPPLAGAAVVLLAGLWLAPAASPDALAAPLLLAGLQALDG